MKRPIQGLYAIVDIDFLPPACAPQEYTRQLLEGGCRIVQLRVKTDPALRFAAAKAIVQLRQDFDFTFIVNDDMACAREFHADGVHVGQDDMPVAKAREAVGDTMSIGYSAHTLAEAEAAARAGADYVAFGAIYPTATKGAGHPVQGLTRLTDVVQRVPVPVVAIGGINRDCVADVINTGVAAVAMITGLSRASDPKCEAAWYVQRLQP